MKRVFPILLVSILILTAFSGNDIATLKYLVLNKLKEYNSIKYPEKIYLHTDIPFYTAGDNIWFSTYLLDGVTHVASSKSSVVYVDLIDDKGNIISERKLFAESSNVQGDFKLPTDIKDGTFTLRAYTNYMRNQSRDFFFKKEIPVYSLYADNEGEDSISDKNMELPDIGFYPEGGYLINGLKNKVAVKVKDADVNFHPILGVIEDSEGNKITDFQTFEFGLGYFYLTPEPGKNYQAIISSKDEDIIYPIPQSLSQGYVMHTSISEEELTIELKSNMEEGLKNTLVIGHQRGVPVFDYIETQNKNTVLLQIPKTDLAEGILDLVVFDKSKRPMAERMVYVKKENGIIVSVKKINGERTTIRDRVNLKIDVKDLSGKPVSSSLSLSVTDAKLIKPNKNAENIKTYLLLNSDLRGNIKSPNYFFTPGDEIKKNAQLDLVMMTHGWRRFDWLEFLEVRSIHRFEPEDGIYISGHTINSKSPFQYKTSETKLTLRQEGFYQEAVNTDKYGRFSYGPFVFTDTIDAIFQAGEGLSSDNPNFNNTNIVLDSPIEKPGFISNWTINPFKQEIIKDEVYREKSRNNIFRNFKYDEDRELLDEVLLSGKVVTKEEAEHRRRERRTRSFNPSHRIVVDDMGTHGGGDFLELLTMVPGLRVERKDNDPKSPTPNQYAILLRGLEPSFYLDNVKVDMNIARSVHQSSIDFIDILNTGPASAAYAFEHGGVIAIYTKQGSRGGGKVEKKPGSITFQYPGFYSSRSFYAPDYSKVDRNNSQRDERTTLYWNPELTVRPYSRTEATFYTHDIRGNIQIDIQGITDSGIPFYTTTLLEIE